MFINSRAEVESYLEEARSLLQTSFYIAQRKKHGIMVDASGKPEGGRWTYDKLNRKRYPSHLTPPVIRWPKASGYLTEAARYVSERFRENPGDLNVDKFFPHTHADAEQWLDAFLSERFKGFGPYQDALVSGHSYLHHAVISPLLNTGLLTPMQVIDRAIEYAGNEEVPLNSLEGFIRQILGWREYTRGIYHVHGVRQRTMNFWGHQGKLPRGFWNGSTGIEPVDEVIGRVLNTGYAHHIERLMVLGNFMLLCGFDPDEVYRWFMSLFVDAFDWVMVPNVYGMSQFSDGGLFATKPYISGSNYILKMGNYPRGEWQDTWDGLYWRFISTHRDFFRGNPRLALMVKSLERMDPRRKQSIIGAADRFLERLS
jgi:deoxyribodipyrimidine photolyase-related protein